jgi:hypothetical protein
MGYIYVATSSELSSWGMKNDLGAELIRVGSSNCPYSELVAHLNNDYGGDWILLGKLDTENPKETKKIVSSALRKCSDWVNPNQYKGLKNSDMIFKMGKMNFLSLLNKRNEATDELLKSVISR